MPSTLLLSGACPPLSARLFSDHDFPLSLTQRWKKPWLQPKSEDAQTWITTARLILKYTREYQRVELSSGHANLPRERPRHAPARRRASRFGRSAPTRASGARVVRWLGRRGTLLPSNGCVILEAGERRV
jgi:hypothetical protein